jgi:hypothetical protein
MHREKFPNRPKRARLAFFAGAIIYAVLIVGAENAIALDWPSQDARMLSNFGQNDQGRPMTGTVFSTDGTVRAADSGEVLFEHRQSDDADGFPAPFGAWIAVDHGDGLVSVYGRLENFEDEVTKTLVEKNSVLGRAGNSGWSSGTGFYFSLLDRKERRWVDPAMIAASRGDTQPPVIRSAWLVASDGNRIPLARTRSIRQGVYRLVVEATDSEKGSSAAALTPQRIICLVNGSEQGSLHLETIKTVEGELRVNQRSSVAATTVYKPVPGFDLGEARFLRGKAGVELIVRDAAGNEKTSSYSILVE